MSRSFKDYEKQIINNSLLEQGKILFSKFGFQKTSIQEITKNVGVAQGTFYNFFNSKEELYFMVLEMEKEKIKEQFSNVDIFKENQPKKAMKKILTQMLDAIEQNLLIREIYFGRNMENTISPELFEKQFHNNFTLFFPLIEKFKNAGFIIEESPDAIAGVFRSLFLLTLHKKEIGVAVYTETIELFIDLIVDGLIKKEEVNRKKSLN